MATLPPEPSEANLHLTIRFSLPLPDLPLTLPLQTLPTTPALSLKRLIRTHLPAAHASTRLRLIHSGRDLPDTASLADALGLDPHILSITPTSANPRDQGKGKGKQKAPDPPAVYIHCSLSDTLSPALLAAESRAALAAEEALHAAAAPASARSTPASGAAPASTAPRPRGFDRLLAAGLSADDVAALRASFLVHLAHTHTPDTLPQGDALRVLEERWLDSTGSEGGGAGVTGLDDDEGSAGEDLFWGNVWGFFWPLGALVWGLREEGVWTRRRQIAVLTGLAFNLIFGFARWSSSR
ncbi:hypothetical protein EJ06DRAFT_16929 [Trichodelitschia bisporula]|uniref:Ubiquitin-like domain-containing protein n=1 Tax=Trichodelitschia bisporula TaxID=703511 RepID=A0A6G1IAR4_9PEZI|nr:hypothetical protein EJ06DRAFT_16929 [Trichodelitschia bisporula]